MILFQFFPFQNPQISEFYKANYPTLAEKGCPFLHTFTPSAVSRSVGVGNCWKSPLACAGVSRTCNEDPKNRKNCVSFRELTTVEFQFSAKHTADAFRKNDGKTRLHCFMKSVVYPANLHGGPLPVTSRVATPFIKGLQPRIKLVDAHFVPPLRGSLHVLFVFAGVILNHQQFLWIWEPKITPDPRYSEKYLEDGPPLRLCGSMWFVEGVTNHL